MSAKLRRNVPVLKRLYKSNRTTRGKILKDASTDTIECLCDCAYNILNGNVPLTTRQYSNLKPYRKQLRDVSKKSTSMRKKRKTFQSGGILLKLLSTLAKSVLGGVLN